MPIIRVKRVVVGIFLFNLLFLFSSYSLFNSVCVQTKPNVSECKYQNFLDSFVLRLVRLGRRLPYAVHTKLDRNLLY